MGREESPYVYGDYWLDKRRDGKAADVWQIATYRADTRSVVYRSTRERDLERAKSVIRAHEERERARSEQKPEDALVIPLLFNYWEEHGRNADSAAQIASSLRQFIGFLMQDEATTDVTVADLRPQIFERFRKWRMAPHSYDVPWYGKDYRHESPGVSGEAFSRNLDDVRAAFGHQVTNERLPYAPKIPDIAEQFRSQPRDLVLTTKQMGAIIGYCAYDIEMLRWVLLMLATAMRPEAALAMDPQVQNPVPGLLDLHPPAWPRTKKHNPVVRVIPEFAPWLEAWKANPHPPVISRKAAWRTMRKALGLPAKAVPKTIRHTVATRIRAQGVSAEEVETLLGHRVLKKTTAVYAKYDPDYLANAAAALSIVWRQCCDAANEWLAVHMLSTARFQPTNVVVKSDGNARV